MQIKKCPVSEAAAVGEFYDAIVKFMDDNCVNHPKWLYKIFPSTEYALKAAKSDTLFICADGDKICAAFVLSENPEGDYSKGAWSQNLAVGEFLVLHAFAVAPDCQRRGLGRKIIDYCLSYAVKKNYRALRLDIVPENFPAQKLYESCGFKFVGAADLGREFSGIPRFCLYERNFYD